MYQHKWIKTLLVDLIEERKSQIESQKVMVIKFINGIDTHIPKDYFEKNFKEIK